MKKIYNAPRTKAIVMNNILDSTIDNTSFPGKESGGDGPMPADLF
jgi:hypothetical protein